MTITTVESATFMADFVNYIRDKLNSSIIDPLSKLKIYHNTGDTSYWNKDGDEYQGQTFTTTDSFIITSAKLLFYRRAGDPGTGYIAIREVDGDGKPTGANLVEKSFDTSLVSDSTTTWIEVNFTPLSLSASTKYALIFYTPSGDAMNRLTIRTTTGDAYTDGDAVSSDDGGSTWTLNSSVDLMFEIYGSRTANERFVMTSYPHRPVRYPIITVVDRGARQEGKLGMQSEGAILRLIVEIRLWGRNVKERDELFDEVHDYLRSNQLSGDETTSANLYDFNLSSVVNVSEENVKSKIMEVSYLFLAS